MELSTHPLAESLPGSTAAPLDERLIRRLRVSLARLLAQGDELATTFYGKLFEAYPFLRPLFPADMAAQKAKLLEMLAWIVACLDRPDETLPAIADLGRRHAGYGALPEHYPLVRDTLVQAMRRTGGREWDDELAQDWHRSIDLITRHMLAASAQVAGSAVADPAGAVAPAHTAAATPSPTATGPR